MKTDFAWKLGRGLSEHMHDAKHEGCACGEQHGAHGKHAACGCCVIPETCCPPRCVGEIKWSFARGATPQATVLVRNVGETARTFSFTATALVGIGVGGATLQVQPASASLQPGESTVIKLELADSLSLRACQSYSAELLITGAWQQCVRVKCKVERDPFDEVEVEQGSSFIDKNLHSTVCRGAIGWTLQRGVTAEATITLHNSGKTPRSFNLDPTPLVGPEAAAATVTLTPSSVQLAPGGVGVVRVKLQNTQALSPGQNYRLDIVVRGFYEQRLKVRCCVEPDVTGHCEVEQGERPTRKRAHQWYDHFQCTESCGVGVA